MLSSLLYVYLVVSFVFEKLFSKSVECFEFLLGFEHFEKTALLLFLSELLHFGLFGCCLCF